MLEALGMIYGDPPLRGRVSPACFGYSESEEWSVRLRGRAGAESVSQKATENASRPWDDARCRMEYVPERDFTLRVGRFTLSVRPPAPRQRPASAPLRGVLDASIRVCSNTAIARGE